MATLGLKNVNLLTKEQYDTIAFPAEDELYAINGSGFGFPSGNFEDLALGASGTTYTAPANGWVFASVNLSTENGYLQIYKSLYSVLSRVSKADVTAICLFPVKKGENYQVYYTSLSKTNYFRFIYAEGE